MIDGVNKGMFVERVEAKNVLIDIIKHKNEWGREPDYKELAFKHKCNPRTIQKKIIQLASLNKVKMIKYGYRLKKNYVLKNKKN